MILPILQILYENPPQTFHLFFFFCFFFQNLLREPQKCLMTDKKRHRKSTKIKNENIEYDMLSF